MSNKEYKKLSNEELIRMYRETGDQNIANYLYTRNRPLFFGIVGSRQTFKLMERDDKEYAYDYAFTNSLRLYDENKEAKFTTFLSKAIYNKLYNLKNSFGKEIDRYGKVLHFEEEVNMNGNNTDTPTLLEVTLHDKEKQIDSYFKTNIIEDIINILKKNKKAKIKNNISRMEKILIDLSLGKNQTDISKELSVSRQRVSFIIGFIKKDKNVNKYIKDYFREKVK